MRRLWLVALVPLLAACTATPPVPPSPSLSPPTPPSSEDATVASLLARPLRLPSVPAGGVCPVSGATTRSAATQESTARGLGTGPLYPITMYIGEDATLRLGQQTPGPDGRYEVKVVWASTGAHQGPVVVRVARADGAGSGAVRLSYQQSASRGDAVVFRLADQAADIPSSTSVSGPGCYAYQIDGLDLAEVIVFRVVA